MFLSISISITICSNGFKPTERNSGELNSIVFKPSVEWNWLERQDMSGLKKIYLFCIFMGSIGFVLYGVFGCIQANRGFHRPPPNVEYASFPKMVVGETWRFSGRAEEYGGKNVQTYTSQVVEVKQKGGFVLKVTAENGNAVFFEYYDKLYRRTKILNFKTGEEIMKIRSTLSPPTPLNFPLYVGLRWQETYDAQSVLEPGVIVNIQNEFEVKRYEDIEIKGKFEKAYRIERSIQNTHNPFAQFSQTYWYVPAYKRIVKIDSSYTTPIEMLSYSSNLPDQQTAGQLASIPNVSYGATVLDRTPPIIKILSHDLSRGMNVVSNKKKVHIRGIATDANGIVEVTVDGRDAVFTKIGHFEADAYLRIGKNRIAISAMDRYGNRAEKILTMTRKSHDHSRATVTIAARGYYALVIGNNDYRYLRQLETAHSDAKAVANILRLHYGFEIKLLLDATRREMLSAMNYVRKKLKPADNFLIYYAGHGIFDRTSSKAYWLPVDAKPDDDTNWIIVDTITSNVRRIAANHVLIVADSCYSGTFTRKTANELQTGRDRQKYLEKMRTKASRTLMASGGNEPVSDIGGEGHSIFAAAFITALEHMQEKAFSAEELFYRQIKERVAGGALQTPEYSVIRNSGHEGGDFLFERNNK